jgi:predicted kinase
MHGLSGSGKSAVARELASQLGAVRCRSDVERKRLFDAWPVRADPVDATATAAAYTDDATSRTYERLGQIADAAVSSGYPIIIDAAFLKREQRRAFAQLAVRYEARFLIVSCEAPDDILDTRVQARAEAGRDPSDATLEVLQLQRRTQEMLASDELAVTIRHSTVGEREVPSLVETICARLTAAMPGNH